MHNSDITFTVGVWVGIFHRWLPTGSPTCMPDTNGSINGRCFLSYNTYTKGILVKLQLFSGYSYTA